MPEFSAVTKSTCPYCGVGCGIEITRENGEVSVKGDKHHPANFGKLCSKGSALAQTIDLQDRLLHPEIKGRQTNWEEALNKIARDMTQAIEEYGPDSIAFYVSGQLLTEDYYVANKLMKGFIGSGNIDTNSRLCMSSSVAAHKRAFGSDTVPGSYEDLEKADLLILTGSNLAWCHPVLFQRVMNAKKARPEMKIVVIDPRRTPTADNADLHLPLAADSDVALFTGLLNHLAKSKSLKKAYIDQYTNDIEDTLAQCKTATLEKVSELTGLPEHDLLTFYELFQQTEKAVTVYSQGVNQSAKGTDKANAIINCHLATGRIGREGMGPFSITGQPNAMGGREVGGLANMLAAHLDIGNPQHHELLSRFWETDTLTSTQGLKAVDLFKAVANGDIKMLWIMATNPVDSLPQADVVRDALKTCPMVIVSDIMSNTDSILHADIKLPAAGWGEKEGTVTNSERRISRQKAFLPLPGDAKPDWWIISEVAKRMGFEAEFTYSSPASIFREHASLSSFENGGTRDFDIGAYATISDEDYEHFSPFQWPQAIGAKEEETRFFSEGGFFTANGKANFIPLSPSSAPEIGEKSLILNTGRTRDQWHTMTRTGKSATLSSHITEPLVEISPEDAASLNITDGELASVRSFHGEIIGRVKICDRQRPGDIFCSMHWTDQFANRGRVNSLVASVTDPVSGQPAAKYTPVQLSPFKALTYGFSVSINKPVFSSAAYWAQVRHSNGWRTELAFKDVIENPKRFVVDHFSDDPNADILFLEDRSRQDYRILLFEQDRLSAALFLSPHPLTLSREWIADQLNQEIIEPSSRFLLSAGRPGPSQPDKGPIICACFSIGANQISQAVTQEGCQNIDDVGTLLKAGTNCGSCKSEISQFFEVKNMIAAE
ncbi:MAG: molybdopterin-dependent oxidoreductase [Sneathiellales bacterium]|nr:molybdopterin-dependent oxidoreductase [Sneathiellales bacterium]